MKAFWMILLAGFAAMNVYAFATGDLSELGNYLKHLGPWGQLATADLLIALTIALFWMGRDARAKGITSVPYLVITLATGSIGLLLYLVRHGSDRTHPVPAGEAGSRGTVGVVSPR